MVAELISVGTELLMGNIVNTNACYLSEKCAELGISVYYQVTVGDNPGRLKETIRTALGRSDLVILTGGLGPTEDDLTKEMTAEVLGRELVEDALTRKRIEAYFKGSVHKVISENNWKQAKIIEGCKVIDNDNGTAPGLYVEVDAGNAGNASDKGKILLLPGPPNELIPMFEKKVVPILMEECGRDGILYSNMVKICGIGESLAETMIKDLIDAQTNPTIAPYAKTGEVHLRITSRAKDEEEGKCLNAPVIEELKNRFGDNIFTIREEETLEEHVVGQLKRLGFTLTAAESCTGGLFSGRLINVAGVSSVYNCGMIVYANHAKENFLGVKHETLVEYGAVSEQTAYEMAVGAAKAAAADAAIGITGLAGPDGGSEEKPVGTVYVACYVRGRVTVKRFGFKGNREKIRTLSVQNAFDLLRRCLLEYEREEKA